MTSSHEHAHRDIHTRIGKDSEGWAAKSTLPFTLPGDNDHEMRLRLYTYNAGKHKGLVTRATVHHLKDGSETHMLFSDYSAIVCQEPCTRATQKAVEAAHRAALSNLDNLVELARAYYAVNAARQAHETASSWRGLTMRTSAKPRNLRG